MRLSKKVISVLLFSIINQMTIVHCSPFTPSKSPKIPPNKYKSGKTKFDSTLPLTRKGFDITNSGKTKTNTAYIMKDISQISKYKPLFFPETKYRFDSSNISPSYFETKVNAIISKKLEGEINPQNKEVQDLKDNMRMKRKLDRIHNYEKSATQKEMPILSSFPFNQDSIWLQNSETFPEVQYPMTAMEAWVPYYGNPLFNQNEQKYNNPVQTTVDHKITDKTINKYKKSQIKSKAQQFLEEISNLQAIIKKSRSGRSKTIEEAIVTNVFGSNSDDRSSDLINPGTIANKYVATEDSNNSSFRSDVNIKANEIISDIHDSNDDDDKPSIITPNSKEMEELISQIISKVLFGTPMPELTEVAIDEIPTILKNILEIHDTTNLHMGEIISKESDEINDLPMLTTSSIGEVKESEFEMHNVLPNADADAKNHQRLVDVTDIGKLQFDTVTQLSHSANELTPMTCDELNDDRINNVLSEKEVNSKNTQELVDVTNESKLTTNTLTHQSDDAKEITPTTCDVPNAYSTNELLKSNSNSPDIIFEDLSKNQSDFLDFEILPSNSMCNVLITAITTSADQNISKTYTQLLPSLSELPGTDDLTSKSTETCYPSIPEQRKDNNPPEIKSEYLPFTTLSSTSEILPCDSTYKEYPPIGADLLGELLINTHAKEIERHLPIDSDHTKVRNENSKHSVLSESPLLMQDPTLETISILPLDTAKHELLLPISSLTTNQDDTTSVLDITGSLLPGEKYVRDVMSSHHYKENPTLEGKTVEQSSSADTMLMTSLTPNIDNSNEPNNTNQVVQDDHTASKGLDNSPNIDTTLEVFEQTNNPYNVLTHHDEALDEAPIADIDSSISLVSSEYEPNDNIAHLNPSIPKLFSKYSLSDIIRIYTLIRKGAHNDTQSQIEESDTDNTLERPSYNILDTDSNVGTDSYKALHDHSDDILKENISSLPDDKTSSDVSLISVTTGNVTHSAEQLLSQSFDTTLQNDELVLETKLIEINDSSIKDTMSADAVKTNTNDNSDLSLINKLLAVPQKIKNVADYENPKVTLKTPDTVGTAES